jgi:hypothetical protein
MGPARKAETRMTRPGGRLRLPKSHSHPAGGFDCFKAPIRRLPKATTSNPFLTVRALKKDIMRARYAGCRRQPCPTPFLTVRALKKDIMRARSDTKSRRSRSRIARRDSVDVQSFSLRSAPEGRIKMALRMSPDSMRTTCGRAGMDAGESAIPGPEGRDKEAAARDSAHTIHPARPTERSDVCRGLEGDSDAKEPQPICGWL